MKHTLMNKYTQGDRRHVVGRLQGLYLTMNSSLRLVKNYSVWSFKSRKPREATAHIPSASAFNLIPERR